MSHIIYYLMVGVALMGLYDYISIKTNSKTRLNIKNQIGVALIWPVVLIIFIWDFIKTSLNDKL